MAGWFWDDDEPKKSVPKKLLRRTVWERDKVICQVCGKPADQFDWELGHNRARSRGGKLTFKNTYVVHSSCNRSQQTLSLREVRRAAGIQETGQEQAKRVLATLTMKQLKYLAKRHHVKLRGKVVDEGWFGETSTKAPTKRRYVNALAKVIGPAGIDSELREMQ